MKKPTITSAKQLERLVMEIGLLPFFHCAIPGYSLEECTPPDRWFVKDVEGPWEWREQIAAGGKVAYAKLFSGKAGFVSMEWYPDLCNFRRNGYDFDARYEDGLASRKCKRIVDTLAEHGPLLTRELKEIAGFGKDGEKGFDSALTLLQMQTYITAKEFVYKRDKYGRAYGWGVGRYILPETYYGEEIVTGKYDVEPAASGDAIAAHLAGLFPIVEMATIHKLIR